MIAPILAATGAPPTGQEPTSASPFAIAAARPEHPAKPQPPQLFPGRAANTSSSSTSPKLTTTSDNSTVSRSCRIFYYNKVDSKTYCVDTSSTVTDNAFVTALTEKLYTAPNNNNNFLTLSKDYGVKSATLDYDTNVLKVVFNNNFLDEMKLDDTTSQGFMASIIDTYAYNYNVNKVAVYFGNDLYTGIDGTSTAGYTTVDYTKVLKLD